jgi:hypothetical protein
MLEGQPLGLKLQMEGVPPEAALLELVMCSVLTFIRRLLAERERRIAGDGQGQDKQKIPDEPRNMKQVSGKRTAAGADD